MADSSLSRHFPFTTCDSAFDTSPLMMEFLGLLGGSLRFRIFPKQPTSSSECSNMDVKKVEFLVGK